MPDTDFDDVDLIDDPEDDNYVRLSKRDATRLRDAAKEAPKLRKRVEDYEQQDAIVTAGLASLTERQRNAVLKTVDTKTPEALRAEAEALGFIAPPEPDPNAVSAAEIEANEAIAAAGVGGTPATSAVANGETVQAWGVDKRMRFMGDHPDLHEALLRGESITLPTAYL